MLVVIFGAGASYDSLDTDHMETVAPVIGWQPPLAAQLFALRPGTFGTVMDTFRTAQAAFMQLQRAVGRNEPVEDAIERFMTSNADALGQRQISAVLFYLQEIIWRSGQTWVNASFGQTNYAYLAQQIERWRIEHEERVTYVTFNYDLMLEEALRPFLVFNQFTDYVGGSTQLLKVHGSVDWGQIVETSERNGDSDGRRYLVDHAPDLFPERRHFGRFHNWTTSYPKDLPSTLSMYPAMALPTRGKAGFVCPPEQILQLQFAIQEMDRLLMIGWKAEEKHMLEYLAKAPQRVRSHVVTSKIDSAVGLSNRLHGIIQGANPRPFGDGFSGYVNSEAVMGLLEPESSELPG
jgi:hypothetical protein